MNHLLYLIGIPGAGKTSLLRAVLAGLEGVPDEGPPAHVRYPGGVMIGRERDGFGGTDALPLNVQPVVIQWLQHLDVPAVVAEGDRLANERFFRAVSAQGWRLSVVYLDVPTWIAAERRCRRGSNQDPAWIRGRESKVALLADRWSDPKWWLDGMQPLEQLAGRLREHPAIVTLWEPQGARVTP